MGAAGTLPDTGRMVAGCRLQATGERKNRTQETGNRRQGMGETGDRRPATGDAPPLVSRVNPGRALRQQSRGEQQATGRTGDRRQATGDRRQATGALNAPHSPAQANGLGTSERNVCALKGRHRDVGHDMREMTAAAPDGIALAHLPIRGPRPNDLGDESDGDQPDGTGEPAASTGVVGWGMPTACCRSQVSRAWPGVRTRLAGNVRRLPR